MDPVFGLFVKTIKDAEYIEFSKVNVYLSIYLYFDLLLKNNLY